MKTRFLLFLLTLIVVCFKAEAKGDTVLISSGDTLLVVSIKAESFIDTVRQQACQCKDFNREDITTTNSDDVSALTFAVNSANNVLTGETILVGVLTFLVAFVGFFEYFRIIKKVKEVKNEAIILKKKNDTIEKVQTINNQYLQKINQWMLENTYIIANSLSGSSVYRNSIMETSWLNFYLMKLYLSNDKYDIDNCINYIKTKGTLEVIEHLQFIVDNDTYKYKSEKASEAIGYILGRR